MIIARLEQGLPLIPKAQSLPRTAPKEGASDQHSEMARSKATEGFSADTNNPVRYIWCTRQQRAFVIPCAYSHLLPNKAAGTWRNCKMPLGETILVCAATFGAVLLLFGLIELVVYLIR